MKSKLIKLLILILKPIYFRKHKGIWGIKSYLNQKFNKRLLIIYESYFAKQGSWIAYNSDFKGTPCFPHGFYGIFISGGASIGRNCIIFHQVTIGSNTLKDSPNFGSPTIGDNVYIGAGAKIIGNIKVGNNCRIGANVVVYKDMPDNSVAVSAPTRIIEKEKLNNNKYYTQRKGQWVYFDNGNWIEDVSSNKEGI